MNYTEDIKKYFERLKKTVDKISVAEIDAVMNALVEAYDKDKQVIIMGNGGSAATASHFVCDFNKGVSLGKKKRFKFICLSDNVPSLMAYGNDISYDDIFLAQIKTYFNKGDIVIGVSGSGNSKNVLKAIEYANNHEGITIGLTGYNGGSLKNIVQYGVNIPIEDMQITEDLHMVLDHLMMKILSEKLA